MRQCEETRLESVQTRLAKANKSYLMQKKYELDVNTDEEVAANESKNHEVCKNKSFFYQTTS